MAYKIERRKIKRKDFVLVYQFEDMSTERPYSVDTWMSIQNWNHIYEQLGSFVETDISFDDTLSFDLSDTPLTCSVSWMLMNTRMGQAIIEVLAHCPNNKPEYSLSACLIIHVTKSVDSKFVTQIRSLKKEIESLKRDLKRSKGSSSRSHSESNKAQNPAATANKAPAKHEEYVPNAVRTVNTSFVEAAVKYKPGKVPESDGHHSNATACNVEKYVPPQVSAALPSKSKYIPSASQQSRKLNESSTLIRYNHPRSCHQTHRAELKVDNENNKRNHIGAKTTDRKRGHSPDLFGTDDDSQGTPPIEADAVRPKKSVRQHDVLGNANKNHHAKTGKKTSKSSRPANTRNVHTNSNAPIESSPKLLSSEELKNFMDIKDEAIGEMKKLSGLLRTEALPDIEVVTLKHFGPDELELRFDEHKSALELIFKAYCKQKDYIVRKPKDLSAFCLNYLLDDKQQIKMMDIVSGAFGGVEGHTLYNDLFWKVLMPEWALAMFMSVYGLDRAAATERMRLQEKITVAKFKIEDTISFDDEDESFEK